MTIIPPNIILNKFSYIFLCYYIIPDIPFPSKIATENEIIFSFLLIEINEELLSATNIPFKIIVSPDSATSTRF